MLRRKKVVLNTVSGDIRKSLSQIQDSGLHLIQIEAPQIKINLTHILSHEYFPRTKRCDQLCSIRTDRYFKEFLLSLAAQFIQSVFKLCVHSFEFAEVSVNFSHKEMSVLVLLRCYIEYR